LFVRFTERARHFLVLAQDEARALKHNYILTEHIPLRVLREEASLGVMRHRARHMNAVGSGAWEGEHDGVRRGLTDTNVRVYASPAPGTAVLSEVLLTMLYRDGLWGEPRYAEIPLLSLS